MTLQLHTSSLWKSPIGSLTGLPFAVTISVTDAYRAIRHVAAIADERGNMDRDAPSIRMHSGQTYSLRKVMLYSEPHLSASLQARADASKALGGSGVGVGVLGAPNLTFAAEAAALGLLSAWMAKSANVAAQGHIERAQRQFAKAKASGRFFDCTEIFNFNEPDPAAWSAAGDPRAALVLIDHLPKQEKKEFCEFYGINYGMFMESNAQIELPVSYKSIGDDFIRAVTNDGELYFRWSNVEAFMPAERSHQTISPDEAFSQALRGARFANWR